MRTLKKKELSQVCGGRKPRRSEDAFNPQGLPPPGNGGGGGWSGLLGGISPRNLNGAVAVARFQSVYAQAEVDVGDMLTFQSSDQCTITTQNGLEIANGEIDVLNGIFDQITGIWTLSESGDWVDAANEIFTGMDHEAAGIIDITHACPNATRPSNNGHISRIEAAQTRSHVEID